MSKLNEKIVTQYIHYDDEGLATDVADTMAELAKMLGVDKSAISLAIKRGSERYAKVQYDEDDEFEDLDIENVFDTLDNINK